jgi:hypothetical protein
MKKSPVIILTIVFLFLRLNSTGNVITIESNISENNKTSFNDLNTHLNSGNGEKLADTIEDTPPSAGPLKDVSNMFNERGYYKSNGFSFDEQEIINDLMVILCTKFSSV